MKFTNSIRFKIFSSMAFLVIAFMVIGMIFSFYLMDDYYESMKRNNLIKSAEHLKNVHYQDQELFYSEAEKESDKLGAIYIIYDYKNEEIINNPFFTSGRGYGRAPNSGQTPKTGLAATGFVSFDFHDYNVVLKDGYELIETYNDRLNSEFFSLAFILDGSKFMIIDVPKTAISDSVLIAQKFFLLLSGILFLIGAFFSIYLAQRISKPIIKLNSVAKNMIDLKFNDYYKENREDEIGALGKSFNLLSTKLKNTISQLSNANERLKEDINVIEKSEKMREEFVSSASHELKTPVAIIQGYANGLKDMKETDIEQKQHYLDVIIAESEHMDKMVKDLLNLSELENNFTNLNLTSFDLASMIDEVLFKYNQMIKDKKINVTINNLVTAKVMADKDKIEHVIRNYISNSLNHVKNENQITIDLVEMDASYQFRIFNSGDNVPKEKLNEIWNAFYKIDKARTREYGGTGLGLAIVRRICELHNFEYGVENLDDGVVFWVEIDKE